MFYFFGKNHECGDVSISDLKEPFVLFAEVYIGVFRVSDQVSVSPS
jgi:hypothetical protein